MLPADGAVLAEHTAQGAAGEENRPRPGLAGDAGLLPEVQRRPGAHRQGGHPAEALPVKLVPQGPALPGTEGADHGAEPPRYASPGCGGCAPQPGPRLPAFQCRRHRPM